MRIPAETDDNRIVLDHAMLINALAAALEAKDTYTYEHSLNVSRRGAELAHRTGLDDYDVETVRKAGLLHDVGKIGIPDAILQKCGALTIDEYERMKKHVEISVQIIKHVPALNRLIPCISCHHERWDGKGYPNGIAGSEIPIEARCLSLADAYDAMTSNRPYRKGMNRQEAIEEIERGKGTQFDPQLAQLFIDYMENTQIVE